MGCAHRQTLVSWDWAALPHLRSNMPLYATPRGETDSVLELRGSNSEGYCLSESFDLDSIILAAGSLVLIIMAMRTEKE